MIKEAIIIEQYAAVSAFGNIGQTAYGLMQGVCAIRERPCFGVPVSFAPFADDSMRDIIHCADILKHNLQADRMPSCKTLFVFCAAKGDIRSLEEQPTATGSAPPSPLLGKQALLVKKQLGFGESDAIVVSNACASGLIGVETAAELLNAGRYDRAVVFGFDAVSRFVAAGFHSLGALSPTIARPFDKNRDGLSLGESASACILTKRHSHSGDAVILGSGSSNDANHRTGPSRTGEGLFLAARSALTDADLDVDEIGAVKCHGTATPYNDAMEAKAITLLFGQDIPPCFSVKGSVGHTSGGGSLLELLIAVECIKRKSVPPTVGYNTHGVDEPIPVSASPQPLGISRILCLSAGFGGVNAAAVVGVVP